MPAANEIRLDDGFSTIITLANVPTIKLYEKDVTPPGLSMGGAIETTTMRNSAWRTMAARSLKTLSPVTATVAYATDVIPSLMTQLGVNQLITVTFPDQSSIEFYGWVEEFAPATNTEGEQPTATITVQPSLVDANGDETAPVYNEPAVSS